MFCRSLFVLFVLFLLAIVLSVLLRFTDSDYLPLVSSNSSYLKLIEHKKTTTLNVGNPGHGLGHAHKYGGVIPVYGIPTLPS